MQNILFHNNSKNWHTRNVHINQDVYKTIVSYQQLKQTFHGIIREQCSSCALRVNGPVAGSKGEWKVIFLVQSGIYKEKWE